MAKIRGIKPAFWTDDKIVDLKIPTRLFFIGLWNFCDDCGVFEFKPMELKMKIFPADNFDTTSALRELVEKNCVNKFDKNGKTYGIITNFQKHQRPDSRFLTFLFPDEQAFILTLSVNTMCSPCVHHDDIEGEGEGEVDIEVEESSTKIVKIAKVEYGKTEINKILKALKETIGIEAFADSAIERNFGRHLVGLRDRIGVEEFGRRLNYILKDDFRRRNCNRVKYLYNEIKSVPVSNIKPNIMKI